MKTNNWKDLQGHKLTIVKGTKFIEKKVKEMKVQYTLSFVEAFDKLNNNETQVVIIPKKAAIRLILRDEYKDIKIITPALEKLDLYHFVHKKMHILFALSHQSYKK